MAKEVRGLACLAGELPFPSTPSGRRRASHKSRPGGTDVGTSLRGFFFQARVVVQYWMLDLSKQCPCRDIRGEITVITMSACVYLDKYLLHVGGGWCDEVPSERGI